MRRLSPFFILLLLGSLLVACGRAKVAAPAPNVAGQWLWSNDLLGSWQLDLKTDDTFQRVIINPLDPQPSTNNGRWVLTIEKPAEGIFQKSDTNDPLLRVAGIDDKDKTIQWSARGTLALFYTVPKGTPLLPGAAWNGVTRALSDAPGAPEVLEIEERHSIRTHTNTRTGEVSLDLEEKVFKTRPGKIEVSPNVPTDTVTAGRIDYLTVAPFPGIQLEVPSHWQAVDASAPTGQPIPAKEFFRPPSETKAGTVWQFSAPGQADAAYIVIAVQPNTLSPQQLTEISEINLEHFAAGFVKGATQALKGKDFLLAPDVKAERTTIGQTAAVLCTTSMMDPEGNRKAIRAYAVPTEAATIAVIYCWDTEPGKPWKAIMERASASLRISVK